jgi:hypothetical protein
MAIAGSGSGSVVSGERKESESRERKEHVPMILKWERGIRLFYCVQVLVYV